MFGLEIWAFEGKKEPPKNLFSLYLQKIMFVFIA